VGTGINTHAEFSQRVCAQIEAWTGVHIHETENHFQAQSTIDGIVFTNAALKTAAVSLMKLANDMRWLGSGPRAGIGEIELPAVQPGSSIMPGKVNPVIAEALAQVCAVVIGNDQGVVLAGQSGNFELNVMMPVAARNLLQATNYLGRAARNFAVQLVDGLQATSRGPDMVEQGLMLVTALAPVVGYDKAAVIAKKAFTEGTTVRELAAKEAGLSAEELKEILNPEAMTEPGRTFASSGG
jgi:fumarate hydratase class II